LRGGATPWRRFGGLPDKIPSAPNQSQNGIRIQPDNHLHSVKHWKDR